MAATRKQIGEWFDTGMKSGFEYMVIKTDIEDAYTWPHYARNRADAVRVVGRIPYGVTIDEVYNLSLNRSAQLSSFKVWALDATDPATLAAARRTVIADELPRPAVPVNVVTPLVAPAAKLTQDQYDRLLERLDGMQKRLDHHASYITKLKGIFK